MFQRVFSCDMPVDWNISAVTVGTSLSFASCWDCWHSASWHPSTPLGDQKIQKQVPASCLQRFGTPRLAPGPASLTNTPRFSPGNSLVSPLSFYCSGQQDLDESVRPATNTQLRNEPKGAWREPHSTCRYMRLSPWHGVCEVPGKRDAIILFDSGNLMACWQGNRIMEDKTAQRRWDVQATL